MRFSVLADFVCGLPVLNEFFFGFAVSSIPQCPLLFGDLGFNVSKEKSLTQPTQVLERLGFVLNSINITVSLTREKIDCITRLAQDILHRPTCSILEATQLIGRNIWLTATHMP